MAKQPKKQRVGMRPVRWTRVTNPFAAPGSYASAADKHGPAGHHTGIDFGSHLNPYKPVEGQPVRSCTPGTVVISDFNSTMGNWVGVYYAEDNVTLTYWHMANRAVSLNDVVLQGTVLGHVGQTGNAYGPHLHLEANYGRGFNYAGHVRPWRWCHGARWWTLFDRRKRAGGTHRRMASSYAADVADMHTDLPGGPLYLHPSAYDGMGSDVFG